MKKINLIGLSVLAIATSAMLFSCTKNESRVAPAAAEEVLDITKADASVVVSLEMEGPAESAQPSTKAQAASIHDDSKNSLQVFIFDAVTKKRENSAYVASGSSATLSSFKGSKIIWAIVNYPGQLMADTEAQLCALTSNLSQNSLSNFIMSGYKTETIAGVNQAVSVKVQRLASRIRVDKFVKNFAENDLKDYTLTLKEIYLKNVSGDARMDSSFDISKPETFRTEANTYEPIVWYSKVNKAAVDAEVASVKSLSYVGGLNVVAIEDNAIDDSTPNNVDQFLFMYPNNVTYDETLADPWSPRKTRLVVHCQLQKGAGPAEDSYYVFNVPSQTDNSKITIRNKTYIIPRITISMRGKANDNDDTLTDPTFATIDTIVEDWTGEESYNYTM